MPQASGLVLYDGPSMLDGAPIVGILTYDSANPKTGPMAQLWILRSDMSPRMAINTGADSAICGGCPHKGRIVDGVLIDRTCYVRIDNAPRSVHEAWARGRYDMAFDAADIVTAGTDRQIRLGAYGDPAALPAAVILALTSRAAGWTGYTHQWRSKRIASHLRPFVQASCDSLQDLERARAAGWSTFTVLPVGAPSPAGATVCANERTGVTCAECMACDGRSGQHITIAVHGSGAGTFTRKLLPVLS